MVPKVSKNCTKQLCHNIQTTYIILLNKPNEQNLGVGLHNHLHTSRGISKNELPQTEQGQEE